MHKKWLGDSLLDVYPKTLEFESALHVLRTNRMDKVRSTARIGLPFSLQPNLRGQHNIAWHKNMNRMVYVDLKTVVDDYVTVNNTQYFEVFVRWLRFVLKNI